MLDLSIYCCVNLTYGLVYFRNKAKKKEKKPKEPRFAFLTKVRLIILKMDIDGENMDRKQSRIVHIQGC
jgi:hypothetical protein